MPGATRRDHRAGRRAGRPGPDRRPADLPELRRHAAALVVGAAAAGAPTRRLRPAGAAAPGPLRLLPRHPGAAARLVPARLADATEVVGAALAAKAAGRGYRRIAAELGRSPSTVRRWLRRARSDRHVAGLYARGVARIHQLDPEILSAGLPAQPTRLGDVLQALAAAVHAYRRRVDRHVDGWALIGAFTAGRLLAPGPSG